MHIFVWDRGRTHIADVMTDDDTDAETALDTALEEPALCGRHPSRHAWARAWQDDDDPDLCDRCARLAEGRGGWHQAGA